MSYSKNVLGLKVLESISFIEKGTALTIELFNNEACIHPATSNDTVVGIALEEYTRGVDNLNGDKISVSIIEFSPAIAGVNIQAGNLLSVNDSGKFIVSDKNIIGVAITNGKLGELFQFVRIFSKESSGGGGGGDVKSVNGMSGDVVIDASKIGSFVDPSTQAELNASLQMNFAVFAEMLEKKQEKLIAEESIEIVDNKINEKVIEGLKVELTTAYEGRVAMSSSSAKIIGRLLYLSASLDGAPQTFPQISLQVSNVPKYVVLLNRGYFTAIHSSNTLVNYLYSASRDNTDNSKVDFTIIPTKGVAGVNVNQGLKFTLLL